MGNSPKEESKLKDTKEMTKSVKPQSKIQMRLKAINDQEEKKDKSQSVKNSFQLVTAKISPMNAASIEGGSNYTDTLQSMDYPVSPGILKSKSLTNKDKSQIEA